MFKNGDWITQEEAMQIYQINRRRLIWMLDNGDLEDNGKKQRERRIKYVEGKDCHELKINNSSRQTQSEKKSEPVIDPVTGKPKSTNELLNLAKLKKIEQDLIEGRKKIKAEMLDEVLNLAFERLKPLKQLTMNLKLSNEELEELKEQWKKSFPRV